MSKMINDWIFTVSQINKCNYAKAFDLEQAEWKRSFIKAKMRERDRIRIKRLWTKQKTVESSFSII